MPSLLPPCVREPVSQSVSEDESKSERNERMSDSGPQVAEGFAVCECGCQREPERSRERARGPVDGETIEERERASARAYVAVLEPSCLRADD